MNEWEGGRLAVRFRAQHERFRGSLFGRPALWVGGAIALALITNEIDRRTQDVDFPQELEASVGSSRALLSAIATGSIAAASVVFSLTLVAVQLSSTAYSSRVLRTFLRDRFQQDVIGLVTGTFVYSLLVLRVAGSGEDEAASLLPRVSVLVATVLAVLALLGLIASINHTAQTLRVANVTRRIVDDTRRAIADRFPTDSAATDQVGQQGAGPGSIDKVFEVPALAGFVCESDTSGWIQQISLVAICDALPEGAIVRLEVAAGAYVGLCAPLLTSWPAPPDSNGAEERATRLRSAFSIGAERTLQQDVRLGLVLLEDIALRALSPGVNDPNTARAVVPQLGELVLAILSRPANPDHLRMKGCDIYRPTEPDRADCVRAAFDQVRRAASDHPDVLVSLVAALDAVASDLRRRGRDEPDALDALRLQLRAIEDLVERTGSTGLDREPLRRRLAAVGWR